MANGRCYWHGGAATGPRTDEGRAKCALVRTTHGRRTAAAIEHRRRLRRLTRVMDVLASDDDLTDDDLTALVEGLEALSDWRV